MTRDAVSMAFETLMAEGDEACLAWLRARGGAPASIELIEGQLTADEAVSLAHGLAELGRTAEAFEVMGALCTASALDRAQGAQIVRGWAQGIQVAQA